MEPRSVGVSTPVAASKLAGLTPKGYSVARRGEPVLYSDDGHLSVAASE